MGKDSKIEWTDHTFNPWRGCDKISAGCKNCYAVTQTPSRVARSKGIETWGKRAARIVNGKAHWKEIWHANEVCKRWPNRPRVFTASMADVFEDYTGGNVCDHKGVHLYDNLNPVRCQMFNVIRQCPNLDFLMLTKRPENIKNIIAECMYIARASLDIGLVSWLGAWLDGDAPENVWLGTSVENQKTANTRIAHLLQVPAKIHFLSAEPLLQQVNLFKAGAIGMTDGWQPSMNDPDNAGMHPTAEPYGLIDWLICGGESGPGHRPMEEKWAMSLRNQCQMAGVAFFMKQFGGPATNKRHDINDFPEDLKVREFPCLEK